MVEYTEYQLPLAMPPTNTENTSTENIIDVSPEVSSVSPNMSPTNDSTDATNTTLVTKISNMLQLDGTATMKHVLIAGIILAIFYPPVIGIIYALCFVFAKATRRVAYCIFAWTIIWTILYVIILSLLNVWIARSQTLSSIGTRNTKIIKTVLPAGTVLPKSSAIR